jgi:hypothetical protein
LKWVVDLEGFAKSTMQIKVANVKKSKRKGKKVTTPSTRAPQEIRLEETTCITYN